MTTPMIHTDKYDLYCGNCLDVMREMEAVSVQCCVTSPPYWGLRDYGTAKWGGGSAECDHKVGRFAFPHSEKQGSNAGSGEMTAKDVCPKCGATRIDNQLGLEKLHDCLGWACGENCGECYVCHMRLVFAEVWRLLREDGVCFLNLGDLYAGSGGVGNQRDGANKGNMAHFKNPNSYKIARSRWGGGNLPAVGGLKPKDLVGIPWRVALALQADGWYLRSDIIWAKPNPMPESVRDRTTKSHEYMFMLTKFAKYFYDQEAIREPAKYSTEERDARAKDGQKSNPDEKKNGIRVRKPAGWDTSRQGAHGAFHREGRSPEVEYTTTHAVDRNLRDVWTVATQSYSEAHFERFPRSWSLPAYWQAVSPATWCSILSTAQARPGWSLCSMDGATSGLT